MLAVRDILRAADSALPVLAPVTLVTPQLQAKGDGNFSGFLVW